MTSPVVTFRATVRSAAPPEAVYAVLADLPSHLVWTGEQARDRNFRLLSMEAPASQAMVGDQFRSAGTAMLGMRFHDTSLVVAAVPGASLAFETTSRLERKHRPALHARFRHRYTLSAEGGGTLVGYTCEVSPETYTPWWLLPGPRAMTRVMVPRAITRNMRNLAALAEASQRR